MNTHTQFNKIFSPELTMLTPRTKDQLSKTPTAGMRSPPLNFVVMC